MVLKDGKIIYFNCITCWIKVQDTVICSEIKGESFFICPRCHTNMEKVKEEDTLIATDMVWK